MKNIFLFPGQGAQKKGMFQEFFQKYDIAMDVLNQAENITGEKISSYMWEIEEGELSRSDRNQLAIITAEIALIKIMESRGIVSDVCLGFSLGEFAALFNSGVLSFEDLILLIQKRGRIMQKVCDEILQKSFGKNPGMAAVIGLSCEKVMELMEPLSKKGICFASNLNSQRQTVISGTYEGLSLAKDICSNAGCKRFIPLKVSGPFHSPLMVQAGNEFSEEIVKIDFKNPCKKLFSNVTGKEILTGKEAKDFAVRHFTNPVRWTNEESEIAKLIGYQKSDCQDNWNIYEVGPGSVLSGLWRDSSFSENISCKSVEIVD